MLDKLKKNIQHFPTFTFLLMTILGSIAFSHVQSTLIIGFVFTFIYGIYLKKKIESSRLLRILFTLNLLNVLCQPILIRRLVLEQNSSLLFVMFILEVLIVTVFITFYRKEVS